VSRRTSPDRASATAETSERALAAGGRTRRGRGSGPLGPCRPDVSEGRDVRARRNTGRVTELDVSRWEELLRALEPLGKVHVIVTNGAVTLEAFGTFGNFSTFGEYFNVQTKDLDMHIRPTTLGAAFAVEKPGHLDGVNTLSFQFYDRAGAAAFKVFLTFGGANPPAAKVDAFVAIRDRFALGS